jgi:Ca-activated chloride channel family protein
METQMKSHRLYFLFVLLIPFAVLANGVAVLDATNRVYCRLDSSLVNVTVHGQISVTVTSQYFTNTHASATVKYAFPLSGQASATQLRWKVHGQWSVASVQGVSQDTTLPGPGAPVASLRTYLGATPLYFSIPQTIGADSTLVVELTYVELLPYASGSVSYVYPNDYRLIDPADVKLQRLAFQLVSQRTIDSLTVLSSQPVQSLTNQGTTASVNIQLYEAPADQNYSIRYTLDAHDLGLFAFNTMLPNSITPDSLGGFLTFIAEPDPGTTTATIPKVFTLIIDQSGSMSGTKITQARDAAIFIVQNLNSGDMFNIIAFTTDVSSFRPGHVPFAPATRDSALSYIASLVALDLTNISGAFDEAVPQFSTASDSAAQIIIFRTDGLPTIGITDGQSLVSHIDTLIKSTERRICVFNFGIGVDADQQLLTLISSHNRGVAAFLKNDELYSRITDFYQMIRNPVLLASHVAFIPPIVSEVYPDSLPDLYKGRQMILSGRYHQAGPLQINLNGTAFGRPVAYQYDVALVDSSVDGYQFLPKVWAKEKIESLLVRYYALNPSSAAAKSLRDQIIALSRAYGVITVFTSFTGGSTSVEETRLKNSSSPVAFELLGNYPNPFNPTTKILIKLNIEYSGLLEVRIYNVLGQIVRVLSVRTHGSGTYEIVWDGRSSSGGSLPSGIYFYAIELQSRLMIGKMVMVR